MHTIRQAFLERVPLDHLRKTRKVKEAVLRYQLTDDDLVKQMRHTAIGEVQLSETDVRFSIEIQHGGHRLTVAFLATQNTNKNLVFWIRSITPRV